MVAQWYFARDGAKSGPFSAAQLKELAASGRIRPQDPVWKEGMGRRVPAAKVGNLFPDRPTKAPPAVSGGQATAEGCPKPPQAERLPPQPPVLVPDTTLPPCPPAAPMTPLAARLAMPEELDVAPGEDITWRPGVPATPAKPANSQRPVGQAGRPPKAPGEAAGLVSESESAPGDRGTGPQRQGGRKRRVLGVKGAVILSQDGQVVRYRKRCVKCGQVDTSVATALIRHGITRADFYCPKCRKTHPVEIHGTG
jgi:hypothetical protein